VARHVFGWAMLLAPATPERGDTVARSWALTFTSSDAGLVKQLAILPPGVEGAVSGPRTLLGAVVPVDTGSGGMPLWNIHGRADHFHPAMVEPTVEDGVAGPTRRARAHEAIGASPKYGVEQGV